MADDRRSFFDNFPVDEALNAWGIPVVATPPNVADSPYGMPTSPYGACLVSLKRRSDLITFWATKGQHAHTPATHVGVAGDSSKRGSHQQCLRDGGCLQRSVHPQPTARARLRWNKTGRVLRF